MNEDTRQQAEFKKEFVAAVIENGIDKNQLADWIELLIAFGILRKGVPSWEVRSVQTTINTKVRILATRCRANAERRKA